MVIGHYGHLVILTFLTNQLHSGYEVGFEEGVKRGKVKGKMDGFCTGQQKGLEFGEEVRTTYLMASYAVHVCGEFSYRKLKHLITFQSNHMQLYFNLKQNM